MATAKALQISNTKNYSAKDGPRAYQDILNFTGAVDIQRAIDLSAIGLEFVQTLFIDNSNSNVATTIVVAGSAQKIVTPPYSQAFWPVMQIGPTFNFNANSAGGVAVPVSFINAELPALVWSVLAAGAVTGTVTVAGTVTTNPLAVGVTDRSGSIAVGGTAIQSMAANGARKGFMVYNPASAAAQNIAAVENLYVNIGTPAVVNDGVSIELLPGASLSFQSGLVPTALISVNAATAAHRFTAKEFV